MKTVRFRDPTYLGDPVNVIRIFNDKEVDELMLLDIDATPLGRRPPFDLIEQISSECFMPLGYGGGIRNLEDMKEIYALGVEKISLNSQAVADPDFVNAAAERFGSQSVVVSIDVKRSFLRGQTVYSHGGRRRTGLDPAAFARRMEMAGAGEILLTSIDRDGTRSGYDLELVRRVSESVGIPVVACGGAGDLGDLRRVVHEAGASAAAAGSLFVFQGRHRAVLINYPRPEQIESLFAAGVEF